MTAPAARIVHRMPGRSRPRTLGMKGNAEYLSELEAALSQAQGVGACG